MSSCPRCYSHLYCFFAVFSLCLVLESISVTFLIGSIQSIERQFQIPSKVTGTVVSARDIGYCIFVIFLAYIGSKGNRAKWIGGAALVIAVACILISSPHWVFSHNNLEATEPIVRDLMRPPSSFQFANVSAEELLNFPPISSNLPPELKDKLLLDSENSLANSSVIFRNRRQIQGPEKLKQLILEYQLGTKDAPEFLEAVRKHITSPLPDEVVKKLLEAATSPFGNCNPIINKLKDRLESMKCAVKEPNNAAVSIIFIGILLIGAAHSLPTTLGLPLIDDNVKKHNAPLYFAAMFSIQIMGPILGFLISSLCSRFYFTLEAKPKITPTDPRWIGAWWVGFLAMGIAIIIPAFLLFFFPSKTLHIPLVSKNPQDLDGEAILQENSITIALVDKHKDDSGKEKKLSEKLKGFGRALLEILESKVYVGILVGRLIDSLSMGFMIFWPKFLEDHYGFPQYKANMVMALMGVCGFTLGMAIGAYIMKKVNLEGRRAVAWVGCCSFIAGLLFLVKLGLGCHSITNSIGQLGKKTDFNFTQSCNQDCFCDPVKLSPVCDEAGNPYFSPCSAGCQNMTFDPLTTTTGSSFRI